jgi:hypothetical protein
MTVVFAPPTIAVMRLLLVLGICVVTACAPAPSAGTSPSPSRTPLPIASASEPPQPAALPTASGTTASTGAERGIWAQIRTRLPQGSPVAMPTWLPSTLDRDHLSIGVLRADAADPSYVVTYSGAGRSVELGMGRGGPPQTTEHSGIGTRVRRSAAVLSFPQSLWSYPTAPAPRVIRWQEAGRDLWVSSSEFTGGDLLRIAWELDLATAPAPPFARVSEGACASTTRPEDPIERLMVLIGSGDADAVMDCFAIGGGGWATQPKAIDRAQRRVAEIGGRVWVLGSWTFASPPAGWTQGAGGTQFFQLGIDGGRWRVFETATAAYGSPP